MKMTISLFFALGLVTGLTGCTLYQSPDRSFFNSNAVHGAPGAHITAENCHVAQNEQELQSHGLDLSREATATSKIANDFSTELFAAVSSTSHHSVVLCAVQEKPDLSEAETALILEALTEVAVTQARELF